jgi:hypothetical protein
MNNKIFAIAVEDYDNDGLNKLKNCKKDLEELIALLTSKYEFDDVEFLHTKEETKRSSIYNRLNECFSNALEEDNILILFAGHGQYNSRLGIAYWQPSDAIPEDQSSWFNISSLLAFINGTEAFHVGIISDSCFSGAIFETAKRGGGIHALNSKRSRLALTSGSIETVSDGPEEVNSPFTSSMLKLLGENTVAELPFSQLALNLIADFEPIRKQTPMYGSLDNVGHEGGSFIFKLKSEIKPVDAGQNKNEILMRKFQNLYIPLFDGHQAIIEKIIEINRLKNDWVKKQNYEAASATNNQVKALNRQLDKESNEKFIILSESLDFPESVVERSMKIDQEYENREKTIHKKLKAKERAYNFVEKEIPTGSSKLALADKIQLNFLDYLHDVKVVDPGMELFQSERKNLIDQYRENVLKLNEYFLHLKGVSKNKYLKDKEGELNVLLFNLYKIQIKYLIDGHQEDIDGLISLKEWDLAVLKWIKD